MKLLPLVLIVAVTAAACGKDSTGPSSSPVQLSVLAGDLQFALPGNTLSEPLQVMVIDAVTEEPVEDVTVSWRVAEGSATVTTATSTTDARGIATGGARLGSQAGSVVIEATAAKQAGAAPRFRAFAVAQPVLDAVAPAAAAAGETVVLTGQNFHPQPGYNTVLFDGIRGQVVSATATRVEVIVPVCVPTREVAVQLWVGAVASGTRPLAATGSAGTPLSLQPGEAEVFADPAALACVRLPGGLSAARYLLVPQNVSSAYTAEMPFELAAFYNSAPVATPLLAAATATRADAFELSLRRREAQWVAEGAVLRTPPEGLASMADPVPGDRRTFNVLESDDGTVSITAEVKAVSTRAVLYQDLAAPGGGFTADDFTRMAQVFDDPIYPTTTGVFGTPSDIDANGRIIILLTPRVNALTPRGETSLIAGYFYGCDLVSRARCSSTNSGEIFYALVPDPQAQFGDARTTTTVLNIVLPVIAHEFQHMISFANRGQTLDALWLSEGLAHTAEDVVGQVFAERGDQASYRNFTRSNYVRASRYLAQVGSTSLIATDDPGTLELRGGAWLLLRYLRAHYGGDALLGQLTRTSLSSTTNVTQQTGESWARILGGFAVALYADGASELAGVTLDPHYTFGSLPVRQRMITEGLGYPLSVGILGIDQALSGQLPSSASQLLLLNAPTGTTYPPIHLTFSGRRGGPFSTSGSPQLMLLRTR